MRRSHSFLRVSARARQAIASPLVLALAIGCRSEPSAPDARPPYLAILSRFDMPPGLAAASQIRYGVSELSGTLGIARDLFSQPGDTVILSLPPATYVVDLLDVPSTCTIREGPQRMITLLETDNTGVLRYVVTCQPSLTLEIAVDGAEIDPDIIYSVRGASPRAGLFALQSDPRFGYRADTLHFAGLEPGAYDVSLGALAPNCVVLSNGGTTQRVTVSAGGGSKAAFRVRCSSIAERPRILSLAGSYHSGASAFVLRVTDPDRDVAAYSWDLTDCRGRSVRPDATPRLMRGLNVGRTELQDTLVIVGAFEVGLPDTALQGRCTAVRVEDFRGNSSAIVEHRITDPPGTAPRAVRFNARLSGTSLARTELAVTDDDGDYVGSFALVRLRDGVLAPFDGNPDLGVLGQAGFLDTNIPNLVFNSRIKWDDLYAVIVYLVDAQGGFTRLEDSALDR